MISASGAVWASASRSAPALKPCEIVLAHELEALAERAAMLLDRPPKRRVGRVVDDDHAFEVRIVEPRHRIERRLEHLRRLHVGRNVDRNLRRERRFGSQRRRRDQPARLAAERDGGDLLDRARARSGSAGPAAAGRARRQTPRRARNNVRSSSANTIANQPPTTCAAAASSAACPRVAPARVRIGSDSSTPISTRDAGELPMIGIGDRPAPGELRLPRRCRTCPSTGRRRLRTSSTAGRRLR